MSRTTRTYRAERRNMARDYGALILWRHSPLRLNPLSEGLKTIIRTMPRLGRDPVTGQLVERTYIPNGGQSQETSAARSRA